MLFQMLNLINTPLLLVSFIVFLIIPLFFSIAFHEMAHGYVAYKCGDLTPKLMGRLTLNPFAHLDPLGTILLFVIGLGWAKPVIINIENIPNKNKQMLVALAGPVSNFLLAFVFATLIVILKKYFNISNENFVILLFNIVITINIALAVFNLIPIPPLDGSRIIAWILPRKLKELYYRLEPYGMFILMLILFVNGFRYIFIAAELLQHYLYLLMGIS